MKQANFNDVMDLYDEIDTKHAEYVRRLEKENARLKQELKDRERKAAKRMIAIARRVDFESTHKGAVYFVHNTQKCMQIWEQTHEEDSQILEAKEEEKDE